VACAYTIAVINIAKHVPVIFIVAPPEGLHRLYLLNRHLCPLGGALAKVHPSNRIAGAPRTDPLAQRGGLADPRALS
jgi:hypothetical protein